METYEDAKKFYEETFNATSAAIRLARWAEANGMSPKKAAKKEEKVVKEEADEE
ncbi:MAG: hypothetical protein QF535_02275 [Anaerolineales bacterium]|jgi:hypothetical protein|nr:hypothetical protein [Anaerolineales bacterium]|tara:strand:- start:779 stop:940 length:162 start_codon:yes stop_codon:yes gene_type:complete